VTPPAALQPHIHSDDRPRERLWRHGAAALTVAELLSIVIGTGSRGRRAPEVAAALVREAGGSLRRLARRSPPELTRTLGVGRAKAVRVLAALELGLRLAAEARPVRVRIRGPADVVRVLGSRLRDLEVEEFHILALDRQHQVRRGVLITRGVLDGSLVHPREVFRPAIAEAAAGIVLVHNHPSGDPTPSAEDRAVTRQIAAAGDLLGIPVLDHVIVAGDRFASLAALGALAPGSTRASEGRSSRGPH
jgi:DNA repair protein RadC